MGTDEELNLDINQRPIVGFRTVNDRFGLAPAVAASYQRSPRAPEQAGAGGDPFPDGGGDRLFTTPNTKPAGDFQPRSSSAFPRKIPNKIFDPGIPRVSLLDYSRSFETVNDRRKNPRNF
jgi:hypothetical protein